MSGLPLAGMALVAGAIITGLAAALLPVDIYGRGPRGGALVAAVTLACLLMSWIGPLQEPSLPTSWWAFLPSGLMAGLVVVPAVAGAGRRAMFGFTGDNWRHVVLVERTFQRGALDYSALGYPRGWHALVASVWSVAPASTQPERLASGMSSTATVFWGLAALFVLIATVVSLQVAVRLGLGRRARGAAGLLGGGLILNYWFVPEYLHFGFQTSILAAVAVLVSIWAAAADRGVKSPTLVIGVGLVVVSHTWQLVVPMVLVLLVVLSVHRARLDQRSRFATVTAIVTGVVVVVVAYPAFRGLLTTGTGVDHAGTPGAIDAIPLAASGVALAALVLVSGYEGGGRTQRWWTGRAVGSMALWLPSLTGATVGVSLCLLLGLTYDDYYPNKVFWSTAVVAVPAVAAALALGGSRFGRIPGLAAAVVGGLVVVTGLVTMVLSPLGGWKSALDGDRIVRVSTLPESEGAAVIWGIGTAVDDAYAQALLNFYRVSRNEPLVNMPERDVVDQCRLLAASVVPVVISAVPEADVRDRFSCTPNLRVHEVPGPDDRR